MNQRRYMRAAGYCVAVNLRAGSTSLSYAIIRRYYPRLLERMRWKAGTFPACHGAGEGGHEPDAPVLLVVRDPVDRFRSTMMLLGLDFTAAFASDNHHFAPQACFTKEIDQPARVFRFPEGLKTAAKILDLGDMPHAHRSGSKPELTAEQTALISERYAGDLELFEAAE